MSFPIWMLLGFAIWTVAVLLFTIGIYRWSRILTGKVEIKEFRGDMVSGEDWYLRAMRAHANCVENLPVFCAIVVTLYISGVSTTGIDIMAGIVLIARMFQSSIHVAFTQTNIITSIRFFFFFAQLICFIGIAAVIVIQVL